MAFTWDHYSALAEELAATYPDCDVIDLSVEDIIAKVLALPDFEGTATPSAIQVNLVQFAWLSALQNADAAMAG